jgi:hypothetical protein
VTYRTREVALPPPAPSAPTGDVPAGGGSDALKARLVEYCASADVVAKAWKALQEAARQHEELERDLQRFWQTGELSEPEKAALKNLRFALRRRLAQNLQASGTIDGRDAASGADVVDLSAWSRAQCNRILASLTKEQIP